MKKSSFLKVLKLLILMVIIMTCFSGKIYAEETYNGVPPRIKHEGDGVRLTDYDVSQYILSQTTDDVTTKSDIRDISRKGTDGQNAFPTGALQQAIKSQTLVE